jgi:hypothetical protein
MDALFPGRVFHGDVERSLFQVNLRSYTVKVNSTTGINTDMGKSHTQVETNSKECLSVVKKKAGDVSSALMEPCTMVIFGMGIWKDAGYLSLQTDAVLRVISLKITRWMMMLCGLTEMEQNMMLFSRVEHF